MKNPRKLNLMEHLTISFLLTRRCNAQCRHCGAWPSKDKSKLKSGSKTASDFTTDEIDTYIDEIEKTPEIEAVGLTGGEVFIVKPLLKKAVDRLREIDTPYTIVTNAFWAKSIDVAKGVLKDFTDCIGIGFSADSFHDEFIPVRNVVNAVKAAESLNIPYLVRATMKVGDTEESMKQWFENAGLPDIKVIQFAPVMYIGEATEKMNPEEFPNKNPAVPCLSLRTPFIMPGGDVFACCGEAANIEGKHPLYLGNLNESSLTTLIKKYDTNPFIIALYTKGPRALWELLNERPAALRDELLLRSPCGTCRLLFEDGERIERLVKLLDVE